MGKSSSAEVFHLITSFEEVRRTLMEDRFADRLAKPLGYWVLPGDRRLPMALLGRSVGDLLATPFAELSATRGIGQKKIGSLVKLLHRATSEEPPGGPSILEDLAGEGAEQRKNQHQNGFDPAMVSEALWSRWRAVVRKYGVGHEKLGRVAPSLQSLPTVIWHTPLSQYLDYTLSQVRRLRTHGEKRVRCILEVYHLVTSRLADAAVDCDVGWRLVPDRVRQAHEWLTHWLNQFQVPGGDELRRRFAAPLLEQIRTDSGETVYRLVEERLGLTCIPLSVRAQAQRMGVTRARIYQLLEDCAKVMNVRWPEGKLLCDAMAGRLAGVNSGTVDYRLFFGLRELSFPEKQAHVGASL